MRTRTALTRSVARLGQQRINSIDRPVGPSGSRSGAPRTRRKAVSRPGPGRARLWRVLDGAPCRLGAAVADPDDLHACWRRRPARRGGPAEIPVATRIAPCAVPVLARRRSGPAGQTPLHDAGQRVREAAAQPGAQVRVRLQPGDQARLPPGTTGRSSHDRIRTQFAGSTLRFTGWRGETGPNDQAKDCRCPALGF
jgi:hypothetical protein